MSYNNLNDLITDLIKQSSAQGAPSIDNFSGEFYEGLPPIPEFWENLVNYLKNEGTMGIGTSPITEGTFNYLPTQIVSVFNYINQKCDLNDNIWNNLIQNISNYIDLNTNTGVTSECTNYFWNESLNKAIAMFIKTMDPNVAQIYMGKNEQNQDIYMAINDVKNADAGWSFVDTWVKPTINIDNNSYTQVRSVDAIQSVLKNKDQLQYTNKQNKGDKANTDSWIRLLMPKYLRKVEVEDLNRNFWVIGQTISAICAYLFGNNSIEDLFKNILNELMQLWENVLYLWAGIAMVSQKDVIADYVIQIIPIPNSPEQGYIKFDNFGTTDQDCITYSGNPSVATANWSIIEERIKSIADQYKDTNLIIIPEIREGNYKHNYYYRVSYPGLLIYDANDPTRNTHIDFTISSGQIVLNTPYPAIDLDYESNLQNYNYIDKIGAIYEQETTYNYFFPYSDIINQTQLSGEVLPYYTMLRLIPDLTISYDNNNGGFNISSIALKFNDVSQELIGNSPTQLIDYTSSGLVTNNELTFDCTIANVQSTALNDNPATIPIEKGYYLGELVSYQSILGLPTISVQSQAYPGQQLMFTSPTQAKSLMTGE